MAHSSYAKFVVLLVCLILAQSHGKKGGKGGGGDMGMKMIKCKGQDANTESIKPHISTCKETANSGGAEVDMKTKFLAMKVCVFEALGVVKDNQFDTTKFDETIKVLYPGTVGDDLMAATSTCLTPENLKDLSKEDNYNSYKPLVECLWKSLANHCKLDGGKKKKTTG